MKKFLALLLVIILAMGAVPALADEVTLGKYGNATWEYKNNVLTFYGETEIGGTPFVGHFEWYYPWKAAPGDVNKIVFDEGITKINTHIFSDTKFVKEIVIPSTLTEIEGIIYSDNLESIVVDENNLAYSSSDGVLFDKEKTRLIKYPRMKEGNTYKVPDSVKVIAERAFHSCDLSEIAFGNGLTDIEKRGFDESKALKRIALPESLANIGEGAFSECYNLTEIYYDGNEEMWRRITKGGRNKGLDKLVVYKYSDIGVTVNGKEVEFESYKYPYIKNERTMVPMRAIFESLGAEVTWDDESKTAIGVKDGVEVKITIRENVIYKNGEAIEIDAAAELKNESTMVPVRAISEAFGCGVEWKDESKTVEITY